jgi:hypothetical protein
VDSTVSSNPEQYLQSSYGFVYPHENNFSITIPSQQILNSGIKKGSRVYFRAYGCSSMAILATGTVEGANYIDPKTGRTIYTSISLQASPVTNITIP